LSATSTRSAAPQCAPELVSTNAADVGATRALAGQGPASSTEISPSAGSRGLPSGTVAASDAASEASGALVENESPLHPPST